MAIQVPRKRQEAGPTFSSTAMHVLHSYGKLELNLTQSWPEQWMSSFQATGFSMRGTEKGKDEGRTPVGLVPVEGASQWPRDRQQGEELVGGGWDKRSCIHALLRCLERRTRKSSVQILSP